MIYGDQQVTPHGRIYRPLRGDPGGVRQAARKRAQRRKKLRRQALTFLAILALAAFLLYIGSR